MQKTVNKTVKYTFEDGKVLESTLDHPIYSVDNGTGYVSYDPKLTLEGYGLEVGQVQVGTNILLESGTTLSISNIEVKNETVKVYNIHDIQDNHNFFANQLLVHNRCFVAGTQISMEDGSTKNIEDVQVGEKVLTYNEQSGEQEAGVVGDLKQHEVTSVIRLTLDNENIIITTEEHPFFIEGKGWVKAGEIEVLDVCKKVDGSESLISTVEKLDETHMVYNLLSVSDNHNFYANGILVHNK
jgi:intein/homing endonuclease